MPRNTRPTATPDEAEAPSVALTTDVLTAEQRRALLEGQQAEVENFDTPEFKIMPQGIGLFEATDDGSQEPELTGVVLFAHRRNTLWDKPFGSQGEDDDKSPGCTASDGITGRPREGFRHLALGDGVQADGTERIACLGCPYNDFETAHLVNKQGKGKACANERVIFLKVAGRALPYSLKAPPTSIGAWDEYVTRLTNRGLPLLAVETQFSLQNHARGGLRWSTLKIDQGRALPADELRAALSVREQFAALMGVPGATVVRRQQEPGPEAEPSAEVVEAAGEEGAAPTLPF